MKSKMGDLDENSETYDFLYVSPAIDCSYVLSALCRYTSILVILRHCRLSRITRYNVLDKICSE